MALLKTISRAFITIVAALITFLGIGVGYTVWWFLGKTPPRFQPIGRHVDTEIS